MRMILLILFVSARLLAQQPAPIAGKVVEFAVKNLGKKIDRGECWDLANAALNYANADWQPPLQYGDKIDYKAGNLKPADVLQFSNIRMKLPNGSMSFPKHTAIVYKAKDNKVTLLHQNFNNKRYVDTLTIDLSYIKSGTVEAYRPKGKS